MTVFFPQAITQAAEVLVTIKRIQVPHIHFITKLNFNNYHYGVIIFVLYTLYNNQNLE